MRSNIGFIDKIIRVTLSLTIALVVFSQLITGTWAIALFLVAYMLLVTSFRGNCPFYRLTGINTNRNLNDKARIYQFHERNQTLLKNYLKNHQEMEVQK